MCLCQVLLPGFKNVFQFGKYTNTDSELNWGGGGLILAPIIKYINK